MVATEYWLALVALGAAGLAIRVLHPEPLLPRRARTLDRRQFALAGVSLAALAFHCGAMFFPETVDGIPGLGALVDPVDELGLVSQLAYWIPAAVLAIALGGLWRPSVAALAVALGAVGVTMFWSFGLSVHLAAIATAVALLAAIGIGVLGKENERTSEFRAAR